MQRIGFVVFEGFQTMSIAALSVFEYANVMQGKPRYEIVVLSEHGGLVRSSTGMVVDSKRFDDARYDTVLVGGGTSILENPPPALLRFMRNALKRARRVASICTGSFILAEAGILDGRRATTHWFHAREMESRYPQIQVEEDRIFIVDRNVWTSAGMTAGIDLALAMVEKDLGAEVTRSIAQKLVLYTAARAASHNTRRCSSSSRSRTRFKPRSPTRRRTCTRRSPSIGSRKPRVSARGNSAVFSARKRASLPPKRSRTFASNPHAGS